MAVCDSPFVICNGKTTYASAILPTYHQRGKRVVKYVKQQPTGSIWKYFSAIHNYIFKDFSSHFQIYAHI